MNIKDNREFSCFAGCWIINIGFHRIFPFSVNAKPFTKQLFIWFD